MIEDKFFEFFERKMHELAKAELILFYSNRHERILEITQDSRRFNINYSNKLEEVKNGNFNEEAIL